MVSSVHRETSDGDQGRGHSRVAVSGGLRLHSFRWTTPGSGTAASTSGAEGRGDEIICVNLEVVKAGSELVMRPEVAPAELGEASLQMAGVLVRMRTFG